MLAFCADKTYLCIQHGGLLSLSWVNIYFFYLLFTDSLYIYFYLDIFFDSKSDPWLVIYSLFLNCFYVRVIFIVLGDIRLYYHCVDN
jgi:hypothetical protein